MDWMKTLYEAVIKGQKNEIAEFATKAVNEGISASVIVNKSVIPAMNRVSELWRNEEYFVPEVMRSASTMQVCMDALKPFLVKGEHGKDLKVSIGTVKGDLHDIGKNLVAIMVEGAGFQVENMGVDLPPEQFVDAAQKGAKVIGLSSLLTTSMREMGTIIEVFEKNGLRNNVSFLVGGAPITARFASEIGADYYAENAAGAVAVLNNLFEAGVRNP